jgi:nucleotide-binding universal stress UspA family protein
MYRAYTLIYLQTNKFTYKIGSQLSKNIMMKKILIALDYDPAAEKIAEKGYELAQALGADVTLLHIVSEAFYYSSRNYSPIMGFEGFNNLDVLQLTNLDELKKAAQNFLDMSKKHLGNDAIKTIVKEGDFGESILETAEEIAADIIVMGSHGRHGLDKMLLGSVAEQVLHKTGVPLFIIPTKMLQHADEPTKA